MTPRRFPFWTSPLPAGSIRGIGCCSTMREALSLDSLADSWPVGLGLGLVRHSVSHLLTDVAGVPSVSWQTEAAWAAPFFCASPSVPTGVWHAGV